MQTKLELLSPPVLVLVAVLVPVFVPACSSGSGGVAGSGGECRVNVDCGGGKVCVSGVCKDAEAAIEGRPCIATRDCAVGLYCAATGTCAKGGALEPGQACSSDAVCKPPLRCNLQGLFGSCAAGGSGEPGASCQASADCLAGLACGRDGTCAPLGQAYPPFAGVTCRDDGAFRAYFEVPRPDRPPADFFRLPFPSDARVVDGKLDIADFPRPGVAPLGVDLVQLYADSWTADFEGFSAAAAVTFRFSSEFDFATVGGETVLYHDLTPGPSLGRLLRRSWVYVPTRSKYACSSRLMVRNHASEPLEPGHTYAVILTTGLRSARGEAPAIDGDLAAVLGDAPPDDAALAHAWEAHAPLRAWLAARRAEGMALEVAAAAVFTVADSTAHAGRLAEAVAAAPAPRLSALALCAPGVTSPCDDGTPARACGAPSAAFHEIHGRFEVPIFQSGTPPYETSAEGGGIAEVAGAPVAVRSEEVCFALTIPKGPTMPAAGWPLVVTAHGTGGSMRSFIDDGVAERVAGLVRPAAAFGFDGVAHGARRGGSTRSPDELVFNPLNPRAARDNFLQGAADVLSALRLAGTVTLDATASPLGTALAFDATAVAFFGHSQGSTSGEIALAYSAAAPVAVLSGAGAFLTWSLLDKTSPRSLAGGLGAAIGEPIDAEHPVMTILQSFFERSDPLVYGPLVIRRPPAGLAPKHVLMTWGTGDTYTPRSTLEANALSLGLPVVGSVLEAYDIPAIARPTSLNLMGGDGVKRTGVVVQYAPAAGADGHFVAQRNQADWTAFLQTYLASGTPSVLEQ